MQQTLYRYDMVALSNEQTLEGYLADIMAQAAKPPLLETGDYKYIGLTADEYKDRVYVRKGSVAEQQSFTYEEFFLTGLRYAHKNGKEIAMVYEIPFTPDPQRKLPQISASVPHQAPQDLGSLSL